MKNTLTAEQENMVEERLGDVLHWKADEIAASLGIHSRDEDDWTDEEAARIVAECDRLYRPLFVTCVLS